VIIKRDLEIDDLSLHDRMLWHWLIMYSTLQSVN